ncbi:MAG: serine/threonine protein kinase [Ardenticatenaceae bacterium]|nr:serine/threonine protein kinase [Ardenticatenaceae bacterium]MCB8947443.1 serine/threonine protein kinase [Ardenticatenaceae bacterium]
MSEQNPVLNGRYELLERIGSGGMSVVYKARDRALGRIVAIKMMHESFTSDSGFLKRFQQEAHAAANLAHPNIVTVHDIGQDEYKHFIVMEYVEGQTLKEIIRSYEGDPLPINRALDLIIQVCNGIGYAHRANLVHCDVKPQNIIVTVDERVKVADFGIARAISGATQQQQVSQVWGTPQYFSPEQAAGEAPTPASDVYAIGIILFEMLTGRLPFAAESHTAMALKHLHTPPPLVTEFNPGIPSQLAQIVNKLLAKEPAGRYRTAGQLGRILTTYRQRSQEETGPIYSPLSATTQQAPAIPVAEQKTEIFHRPDPEEEEAVTRPPMRPLPKAPEPVTVSVKSQPNGTAEMDWTAVSLGIFALVALLGLIPLWYLVFRAWVG